MADKTNKIRFFLRYLVSCDVGYKIQLQLLNISCKFLLSKTLNLTSCRDSAASRNPSTALQCLRIAPWPVVRTACSPLCSYARLPSISNSPCAGGRDRKNKVLLRDYLFTLLFIFSRGYALSHHTNLSCNEAHYLNIIAYDIVRVLIFDGRNNKL